MTRSLLYSRNLAFGFAVFLPLMETIRRWDQLTDLKHFYYWFDDYLMGGILFFAAWMVKKYQEGGRVYLAAIWGIAVGGVFLSTLGQLEYMQQGKTDPAPVSSATVFIIKAFFLLLSITGMILCFAKNKNTSNS